MSVLCRFGLHRWAKLGSTWWLQRPRLTRNELGTAIEARVCERCGRLTDVTTWMDTADEDYEVPKSLGPLAEAEVLRIIGTPRHPLPGEPLPPFDDKP